MNEQQFKERCAEILRNNITFSPQIGDYVIHGALDELWKLHNESKYRSINFEEMIFNKRFPDEEFDADSFYDWASENSKQAFYICLEIARDLGFNTSN